MMWFVVDWSWLSDSSPPWLRVTPVDDADDAIEVSHASTMGQCNIDAQALDEKSAWLIQCNQEVTLEIPLFGLGVLDSERRRPNRCPQGALCSRPSFVLAKVMSIMARPSRQAIWSNIHVIWIRKRYWHRLIWFGEENGSFEVFWEKGSFEINLMVGKYVSYSLI